MTPWSLRLVDRLPVSAFWGGVTIALGCYAVFLVYTAAFGAGPGQHAGVAFRRGWIAETIQSGFLGFAVAVVAASVRGARREFEALRPALDAELRRAPGLPRELLRYPRLPLAALGLASGLSSLATVLSPELWAEGRFPGWRHPTVLWIFGRSFLTWWIVLRGMALELILSRRFSALAQRVKDVDLFERDVFAPFVRRALRNVLLWMLLAAWISLTFIGADWALPALMALGITTLGAFALAAFLTPLLGPHRRLRALRREELARVRAALREAREHALAAPPAASQGGRLADLLAWEARVSAVSAWPIEASTLVRFGLYLALGLGSWIGAGLVQHWIERALGG